MPAARLTRLKTTWYRRQWTAQVEGDAQLLSPTHLVGPGQVRLTGPATFGWPQGLRFHSGYIYVETRDRAVIKIGAGSHFNNAVTVVSDGPSTRSGERRLLGAQLQVHDLTRVGAQI
jgi:hypothetical protein